MLAPILMAPRSPDINAAVTGGDPNYPDPCAKWTRVSVADYGVPDKTDWKILHLGSG